MATETRVYLLCALSTTVSRVLSATRFQCYTRMLRSVAPTSQYLFGVYLRRLSMPERSISPLANTMSKDIAKISAALTRSSGLKRCQHGNKARNEVSIMRMQAIWLKGASGQASKHARIQTGKAQALRQGRPARRKRPIRRL